MLFPPSVLSAFAIAVNSSYSRTDAERLLNESIFPVTERGDRLALLSSGVADNKIFAANDPQLHETYGEFPLSSMDMLIDAAEQYATTNSITRALDLGSGCGRLALYMALTRPSWQYVHGIEISATLHEKAVQALQQVESHGGSGATVDRTSLSAVSLHLGPASSFPSLLRDSDLIFCYSTAFESSHFSETAGGLVLAQSWNDLLRTHCTPGCICITTDKVLDPDSGWRMLDRLDVPNPEVMGSTGFIQVFDGPNQSGG